MIVVMIGNHYNEYYLIMINASDINNMIIGIKRKMIEDN